MIARLKRLEPVQLVGLGLLMLAGLVTVIGAFDQHREESFPKFIEKTFDDFYSNVGTELASIAITILIIDRLQERSAEAREKNRLILQMGSPDKAFAVDAVRMLNARGWLREGTLSQQNLNESNLESANLKGAVLRNTTFWQANLRKVKFNGADLRGADFHVANLEGAHFSGADLRGAKFKDANWANVKLDDDTMFDRHTLLPDGTNWTPSMDVTRYTNPQHPEYWRSRNTDSPACNGHKNS